MSLDYYLFCRKRCNNIINKLKETTNNNNNNIFLNELNLTENNNKLTHFINLKNICERKIHKLCQHDFIDDYIDINPERSQKITYCTICEYTK